MQDKNVGLPVNNEKVKMNADLLSISSVYG